MKKPKTKPLQEPPCTDLLLDCKGIIQDLVEHIGACSRYMGEAYDAGELSGELGDEYCTASILATSKARKEAHEAIDKLHELIHDLSRWEGWVTKQ